MVLIGGLLSSPFLVITVFPYYYLGGEYLRSRVSRKAALLWLASVIVIIVVVSNVAGAGTGFGIGLLVALLWPIVQATMGRLQSSRG